MILSSLSARISEEDDGFALVVRLYNPGTPEHIAWGEELTESFEMASRIVAALADEFSILQSRIKIEIRMQNIVSGTQH